MVFINQFLSALFNIETCVPQGGVLSPVLFRFFINDILLSQANTRFSSNLFADDLASSCSSKSSKKIERVLNLFLINMEKWLFKWRLEINAKKCQFIIFGRKKQSIEINLKLFNEQIPKVSETKFLGVTLDSRLNFSKCVEDITNKCNNRLNIIKILSHKSWKLESNTVKAVYYALIRSIIDYNSIIYPLISKTNRKKINSIQYKALRIAFKQPVGIKTETLLESSKFESIENRINLLNGRYL